MESLSSALIQVERMVENRFIDLQLGEASQINSFRIQSHIKNLFISFSGQKDKKSKQKQKKKENDGSDDGEDITF